MRIAVFGISGRTGRAILEGARERGLNLVALVRPTANVPVAGHLRVYRGDLADPGTVQQVVANTRAVVCVLGPRPPFGDIFCAAGTGAIISTMKACGVARLICQTGAMIGPLPRTVSRPMRWAARRFAAAYPAVAADRAEQEALVRASALDWTLVKPPRLTDRSSRRPVTAGPAISVGLLSSVGRPALAAFLLDEVLRPQF
ncbi:MAG TPA: NAD(P)H-binding protein, partial [Gemmatimonadales bacterium]|nr:NAD(P)H-binding protein [Gemmatimonadales bacterium]